MESLLNVPVWGGAKCVNLVDLEKAEKSFKNAHLDALKSALIQVRVRPNEDEETTCVLLSDGNFFFVLESYSMAKSMHLTPIEANEISANHLKPR